MTARIPAPPDAEPAWSISTLAAFLCVPTHTVYEALFPLLRDGVARVFQLALDDPPRTFLIDHGSGGWQAQDMYLTAAAAQHLVDRFPAGPQAREIVAAGEQYPGDDVHRMAAHLVEHLGGGVTPPKATPKPAPPVPAEPFGVVIPVGSS